MNFAKPAGSALAPAPSGVAAGDAVQAEPGRHARDAQHADPGAQRDAAVGDLLDVAAAVGHQVLAPAAAGRDQLARLESGVGALDDLRHAEAVDALADLHGAGVAVAARQARAHAGIDGVQDDAGVEPAFRRRAEGALLEREIVRRRRAFDMAREHPAAGCSSHCASLPVRPVWRRL